MSDLIKRIDSLCDWKFICANPYTSKVLLDCRAEIERLRNLNHFVLDDEKWEAFQEMLNRPPQDKPKLAKLLREPSVLESQGIDALIAEIDGLHRYNFFNNGVLSFDEAEVEAVLDKYRNTK